MHYYTCNLNNFRLQLTSDSALQLSTVNFRLQIFSDLNINAHLIPPSVIISRKSKLEGQKLYIVTEASPFTEHTAVTSTLTLNRQIIQFEFLPT